MKLAYLRQIGLWSIALLVMFCPGLLVLGQNPPMPTLGTPTNQAEKEDLIKRYYLSLAHELIGSATNNAETPPPLPVAPGGARVALSVTNGVHEPPKPKIRSTGRYGVVCPSCETAQTNTPTGLKCVGQVEVSTNQVRFQYQGEFKCRSCGIQFQKSWYGPVQNDTPVIEVMEEIK